MSPLFTNTYALVTSRYLSTSPYSKGHHSCRQVFFTSDKSFFCSAVPPVAPFVGASDIGQGYNGPKTGDQGQGIEPWTHKNIMLHGQRFKPWTHKNIVLHGQGFEPWTHKIDRVQGQGFEPWTDRKDRLYDRARDH